jgi:predicted HAD superfamily Cof-like phosphohydrolase
MSNSFKDVLEFHTVAGQQRRATPELPESSSQEETDFFAHASKVVKQLSDKARTFTTSEAALRSRLILEETAELLEALSQNDLEGVADALVDLDYVVLGSGVTWGVNMNELHDEVHRANMAKFPGGKATLDENGKVIKPKGWKAPDVEGTLKTQTPLFTEE